jgi:hypothetical protein
MKIFLVLIMVFLMAAQGDCPTEYEKAERSIKMLLEKTPNHKLNKNSEKRIEMAKSIVDIVSNIGLEWELVMSIIYFESSFKPYVISKDEQQTIGLMQFHGAAITYCEKQEGRKVNLKDYKDQIRCGTHWLKFSIEQCDGKVDQGISMYATGYKCNYHKSKSLTFIVKRRIALRDKIKSTYEN